MDTVHVQQAIHCRAHEHHKIIHVPQKRKTHPDGRFDKYKARLVAGGDQQNKNLYDDVSSPTVSTSAVFTIAAICAHERRHAAVVDIEGAFLNVSMATEVPVHMRLRTSSSL